MAISGSIPFHSMPHQSRLFLSYLDQSPEALAFYQHAANIENLMSAARTVSGQRQFPRKGIVSILRRQNLHLGAGSPTLALIEELEDPDCVAVLTGQQVGLFTGPLYTIYKAFSAIKVAETLHSHGIRAVPIFWMDSEDHDLAEVTHLTALSRDSSPVRCDCRQALFGSSIESLQPVGSIKLPERVDRLIQESIHPDHGRYADEVRSDLASTYNAGNTFSEAFGRLMARLFREYGLILFDPLDTDAKRILTPVYRRAAEQAGHISTSLLERGAMLASAGFHAQVNVLENSTVLFHQDRGERRPLIRNGSGFMVKGTDLHFSRAEILAGIEGSPDLFSSNVLLRPIVQDYLFPTAAYVAGPAEIAYFAQIAVLYKLFERPMPVIWPRCSFTLIEGDMAEKLAKYNLELADCFGDRQRMLDKAMRSMSHSKAGMILAQLKEDVDASFESLHPRVVSIDPSLGPAMETARRKIIHNLHALSMKSTKLDALQSGSVLQDMDAILNYCYPNKNFQEREMCIVDFLVRQGPALIGTIHASCKVDSFAHGIILLESSMGA